MELEKRDLSFSFDAVVMLTWSDWHAEMRSNRYHYASRFARHCPVIFVQPDQFRFRCSYEPTELPGVTILHASRLYGRRQAVAIAAAIEQRGVVRPLLWIYNHEYADLICGISALLTVYHATEDYFYEDIYPSVRRHELRNILHHCDLLVAASEGVQRDYQVRGQFTGPSCILNNGCDFTFWKDAAPRRLALAASLPRRVVLFQGNVNGRLDFRLLRSVAERLRDWTFAFCGPDKTRIDGSWNLWHALRESKNVEYWGVLSPESLKEAMCQATVGIIPFSLHPVITNVSRPLKAFEYLACGLPVVSVPIAGLQHNGDLFRFATTAEQFAEQVVAAGHEAYEVDAVQQRVAAARREDYDQRFAELCRILEGLLSQAPHPEASFPASASLLQEREGSGAAVPWKHRLPEVLLAGVDHMPAWMRGLVSKCRFRSP